MTYSYDRTASTIKARLLYARLKTSMSVQEAARVLEVSPSASADEIHKAYKKKVFENHPDRGGSTEKMVEVNVAKEILDGKQQSSPSSYGSPSDYGGYTPPPRAKREKEEVTFEEAASKAGVPSMSCVFKTATRYDSQGDRSIIGYVVYGSTSSSHVFVGVENYSNQNAFTREDSDLWSMRVYEYPLSKDLAEIAPGALRGAFANFQYVTKNFNAKVELFAGSPQFNKKITHLTGGKVMSFKDAMVQLGAVGSDSPWANRKLTITIVLEGYHPEEKKIRLDVSGKDYILDGDAYKKMEKARVLKVIFGDYYYEQSKKVLTRIGKAKMVLTWMVNHLTLSDELRGILQSAADQAK